MESPLAQLERVQAAIAKIESGVQAYTAEGESFTRASLPALYARERELKRQVAAALGTRPRAARVEFGV